MIEWVELGPSTKACEGAYAHWFYFTNRGQLERWQSCITAVIDVADLAEASDMVQMFESYAKEMQDGKL
jgi:hypothetical protein